MGQIFPTTTYFGNGESQVTALPKKYLVEFRGTWATGEKFTLVGTQTLSGLQTQMGAGTVTGLVPTFLLTYNQKLNFLAGTTWYFSAVDQPTVYNDLNAAGNGFIDLSNYYSAPENLQALAPYQGKMVILGRGTAMVFAISADPAAYERLQTLDGEGTFAPLCTRPQGELDVYYLNDAGVRSFRARETTLNAIPDDVGSPIDITVLAAIASATSAERVAACGIVNPEAKRYWLYLDGVIYVFSSFPKSKVFAWSTYLPTYQSTDVMRITNNSGATVYFKLGEVNNVGAAKQTTANVVAAGTADVEPARYIWVYSTLDVLLGLAEITDGFAFRGSISWNGATFSFTNNQTSFIPQKFVTQGGIVIARASDAYYVYGGSNGNTFDNCVGYGVFPWLDNKSPATEKTSQGVDLAAVGYWDLYASMDYVSEAYDKVVNNQNEATFNKGRIDFPAQGTHFSLVATTRGATAAVLSSLIFHYNQNNEK